MRRGKLEDDEDDLAYLLPPPVAVGPGVKKVIEYRFDDEGNKVKAAATSRVVKVARTCMSKGTSCTRLIYALAVCYSACASPRGRCP
jgi:hypothetical protein